MSAEVDSWRVTLPCTRAEAEAIDAADDWAIDAVLMTTEEVEDDREHWRLDAYVEKQPDDALLATATELARRIAGFPRDAVRITKAMIEDNRLVADPNTLLARERAGFVEQFRALKAARQTAGEG